MTIEISATVPLQSVAVNVVQSSHDVYELTIELLTDPAPSLFSSGSVTLPPSVRVLPGCTYKCSYQRFPYEIPSILGFVSSNFTTNRGSSYSEVLSVKLKSPTFAWDENGLSAETWIPEFEIEAPPASTASMINLTYHIPDWSHYDWSGGSCTRG